MKLRSWGRRLIPLTGASLVLVVCVYPLTHSSRLDALEPHLRPFTPLSEIQQVAAEHGIPLEPDSPGSEPGDTNFTVPLNGSKWGKTLYLTFRERFGLWSATIV